jgi:ankyrin repeat protein
LGGFTALISASWQGHLEVVRLLIENGVDLSLDRKGETALRMAVLGSREPVVRLLVEVGAAGDPVQIRLSQELHRAACQGAPNMGMTEGNPLYPGVVTYPENVPDLQDVLRRGADVNRADGEGYTALMYVANLGLVENVRTLLANGADATLRSREGETALSLAERPGLFNREGRRQVFELLQRHLSIRR